MTKTTSLKACVVRSEDDIGFFSEKLGTGAVFLCTTLPIFEKAQGAGSNAVLLDEGMALCRFEKANEWAFHCIFRLIREVREEERLKVLFESTLFTLQTAAAGFLKFILTFERLAEEKGIGTIFLRENAPTHLSIVLTELSSQRGIFDVEVLKRKKLSQKVPVKAFVRDRLYKCAGSFWTTWCEWGIFLAKLRKRECILVSGALGHLKPVIEGIRKRKDVQVIFCENEFNYEKWAYCLKQGIIFKIIGPEFVAEDLRGSCLKNSFPEMDLEGKPLTPVLSKIFSRFFDSGLYYIAFSRQKVAGFLERVRPSCVILNEDHDPRRVIAVHARNAGIPVFVISHGIPAAPLNVFYDEVEHRSYERNDPSTTFVNSEFEKTRFMAAFQEPSKLVITGLPRYDAIFRMAGRRGADHSGRKNILLCSELMTEPSFERVWLFAKPLPFYKADYDRYLHDVLDAAGNIPEAHIVIKPHFNNEHVWLAMLQKHGIHPDRWTLLPHSADIFELMADADLIISPESSAIVEAIMFRKPVMFLNYGGIHYKVPSYESTGAVVEAADRGELNDKMRKLLFDEQYLDQLSRGLEAAFRQFSEFRDGRNTERVVEKILEVINR